MATLWTCTAATEGVGDQQGPGVRTKKSILVSPQRVTPTLVACISTIAEFCTTQGIRSNGEYCLNSQNRRFNRHIFLIVFFAALAAGMWCPRRRGSKSPSVRPRYQHAFLITIIPADRFSHTEPLSCPNECSPVVSILSRLPRYRPHSRSHHHGHEKYYIEFDATGSDW